MFNRVIQRVSFSLFLVLLTGAKNFAQPRLPQFVPVFADCSKGDSIWLAIEDLFTEFKKVSPTNYTLSPASAFAGKGILFVLTGKATKNTKLAAGLKRLGPEGIYIRGDQQSVVIAGNTRLVCHDYI